MKKNESNYETNKSIRRKMKTLTITIIMMVMIFVLQTYADTYFVRYVQDTGIKTAYDKDFPYTSYTFSDDGTYFTGFPYPNIRQGLFSTTNDPDGKTNINQFEDAVILLHPKEDYIQAVKPLALKQSENKFMDACEEITGQKVKLGFDELEAIIAPLQTNNPSLFMGLSIKMMAINQELIRAGGVKWWDTCVYHPEVVGMVIKGKSKYTLKRSK